MGWQNDTWQGMAIARYVSFALCFSMWSSGDWLHLILQKQESSAFEKKVPLLLHVSRQSAFAK